MGYSGNAYHIPLVNGRNNNSNQAKKLASDLEVATNIALHEGNIQKDFGEVNINASTLTDAIRAGFDYYPTPSTQRTVIFTSGGAFKKSSGVGSGSFSDLKTGLTGDSIAQLVQAGRESTSANPKLFLFNGLDFPQYIDGDGSTSERIGFRTSLTNKLSTANTDATLTVNYTAHGMLTGDTVSLVGFTNPLSGQNPNVSNAAVTVVDPDNFTVEMSGNANATASATGGTGKVYAHPVDWTGSTQPDGGVQHANRLIVFLNQSVYGSALDDHTNFEVGTVVDAGVVYSGIGAKIQCITVFQDRLVIFKNPTGIIQIQGIFTADQQDFIMPIQLGIAGKNAFCYTIEGDLLFISNLGSIHSLAAVQEFGDIRASSLTNSAYLDNELKSLIDVAKLSKATMSYDPYNKVAYAAYTKKGSTYNDLIVKIDLSETRPRISYTDKGSYVSLWNQKDSSSEDRIVAGTSNGYLRNMLAEQRTADGQTSTAFTSTFRTAYTDLRDQFPNWADQNKHFDFLEFTLQPTQTDINLQFNIYVQGSLRFTTNRSFQTAALTFPMAFPLTFANDDPREVSIPLTGCYGRKISVEVINASSNQNFKISDLKIKFRPGDERIIEN